MLNKSRAIFGHQSVSLSYRPLLRNSSALSMRRYHRSDVRSYSLTQPDHPVRSHFRIASPPSKLILDLLNHDVEYVHSGVQYANTDPKKFYSGFDLGWGPVIDNLDVRRSLVDRILSEVVLRPEEDRPTIADLYVIKAAAGSGKSTVLRRIAWEAATGADELCLFATQPSTPSLDALAELAQVTDSRIFLFIDDAADNTTLIKNLISQARGRKFA